MFGGLPKAGAFGTGQGGDPRFRGAAPPAPPRRLGGAFGAEATMGAFRWVWFRLLSRWEIAEKLGNNDNGDLRPPRRERRQDMLWGERQYASQFSKV